MRSAAAGEVFDYGVTWAPFHVEGFPAIMAVDSYGNIRKIRRIRPGEDAEELGERLWMWLRQHHPERPKLALVPSVSPDPERTSTPVPSGLVMYKGRAVDPRLLSDPRSSLAKALYRDRLVKATTRRAGVLRFRRDDDI